jgi:hypothetical protein
MGKKDQDIARDQNRQSYSQGQALEQNAVANQNAQLSKVNSQIDTLTARNPWEDAAYKQNQNLVESSAATAQNDASKAALQNAVARTGTNSASLAYNLTKMDRMKAQMLTQQQSERQANDYNKWIQLQQWATAARMDPSAAYGQQAGIGAGNMNSATGSETQLAAIPSFGQSMLNAGAQLGGAAIGAYCPAEGAKILLFDGTEKPVEELKSGDVLMGVDGKACPVLEDPSPRVQKVVKVESFVSGLKSRVGVMHTFMTLHGGYEFAGQIEGKKVRTGAALRTDATTIDKVLPGGTGIVFPLQIGGTHTYRADGFWALM